MVARIFKPAKTAMQSGKAKADRWMLTFEPESPITVEPLMGYNATGDMNRQIKLSFETKEEAVAYAEKNGIPYRVFEPHLDSRKKISYSDNFKFGRAQPWTH
ncbi:hypothetical protein GGR25_000444 [Kaistia hirudinis]|uniref:ETC complex I subunit n=1 Tax=Kaistia hirudinis TaxID=1293440 RepID=A0A840ALI5_9HYPH|nr:ETC complex I subunit [Kaistia hirudinis]MBB3929425.1 hypothetical protein [Kaistia hirudinis]MBN9018551.1 ETC complex I subunit [Hyphomicrobiales bacterium]